MTQPKLLELAKQGEPQAIAILMNRSLQPQGMSVKVTREGDRLSVLLQADQTPNRLVMTNFVRNGIANLKLESVLHSVEIIGQRTGDDQPAWVQELQLADSDYADALLGTLGSTTAESANSDVISTESPLDLDPAPESAESLGNLDDPLAIANDFNFEDSGLLDENALAFDEDPLAANDVFTSDTADLEFGSAEPRHTDLDLNLSESSDLSSFDLGGELSDDSPSFGFDEDSSEFSTLDLGSSSQPEDESLSLFADESNNFGLESLDSSLGTSESSFETSLDESNDLFGLESASNDEYESGISSADESSDLFGLASSSDDAFDPSSFESLDASFDPSDTSETADSFDSFGLDTTDNLGLGDFSTSSSDDFSLESDFDAPAASELFADEDLTTASTNDSEFNDFENFESSDRNLGTLDEVESTTDSDFFGALESLNLSSDESSTLDFASDDEFSLSSDASQSEDLESTPSISDEVAALFGETDSDLESFETYSAADDESVEGDLFSNQPSDAFISNDLDLDSSASDSFNLSSNEVEPESDDVASLFADDSALSSDSADVDYGAMDLSLTSLEGSSEASDASEKTGLNETFFAEESFSNESFDDETLDTNELTGVETLSDEYLGFETATTEDNPVPADSDFGLEVSADDWDALNTSDFNTGLMDNSLSEPFVPLGESDLSFDRPSESVDADETADLTFDTEPSDVASNDWAIEDQSANFSSDFTFDSSDAETEPLFESLSDSESQSDLDLTLDTSDGVEWTEESVATPESELESNHSFADFDLTSDTPEPESEYAFSADADVNAIADLDLNGGDEQPFLDDSAFLGEAAFADDWVDEPTGTSDRAEESFLAADNDVDVDLSGLELDDTALNDFADSSEEIDQDASRFDLTSGDLNDDVDSASGFVIDTEAALPPEFIESEAYEAGIDPMDPSLGLGLSAIAPETELSPEASASPIADLTPLAENQDASDWASTQDTLIDEDDVQFNMDDETLDTTTDHNRLDLDDEIILTPDVQDQDLENWDDSSLAESDDVALSTYTPEAPETDRLTPEEAAALAFANQTSDDGAIAPPPHDPTEPSEPSEPKSSNRGLLALIAALIGIWLLGLLAISLFRREPGPAPSVATNQDPNTEASPTASPADSPGVPTPAPENAFQEGLTKGFSAATLAQTAQSADDWGLVVSQWQQAIDLFRAVPESSPDYAAAQQKIAEYEGNLAVAQQRLESVPATAETPSTAPALIVSGDITCQAIASNEESPSLEFSNVQVSNARLVGCLTNHTELPVNAVSVIYQPTNPNAAGTPSQALGRLEIQTIQPGETKPFQSDFTLASDIEEATVQSVVWSSPTMSEPQQEDVQVSAAP